MIRHIVFFTAKDGADLDAMVEVTLAIVDAART